MDDKSKQNRLDFFMSIESLFNDEFINVLYSQHQSSLYQLMRSVSSGLYSGKNRTNTLQASININTRAPLQYIPDVQITMVLTF